MKETDKKLDDASEKILLKLDSTIGLGKTKEPIREIIRYHEVMQKYNCNIEFENYNIIIRNQSSYNLYVDLVNVIAEIYYQNKIVLNQNVLYLEREQLKPNTLNYKEIEEGIIVIDLMNNGRNKSELRKIVEEMIENMPQKSFIILENEYREGEVNAVFTDYFSWAITIDSISNEEKEQYIEKFMKDNELICDTATVKEIANNPYYKIKNRLSNILVDCKISGNNKVSDLMENKEENTLQEQSSKTGIEELEELIGLEEAKEQLKKVINYIKVSKNRENLPMLHMVFTGNPGTGKTTVARIVGKIFSEEKILSDRNRFVEAQRCDLIGVYVGQTAPKTQNMIERALGGVLFVDEAYSIASYIQDEAGGDYGAECVATLLKGMEDHRDNLCVILAGYTDEMKHMLNDNPGFASRIQFEITFPDYSAEELYTIFKKLCQKENYKLSSNLKSILLEHFEVAKTKKNFSNARYVRSLFEKVKIEQANRVIKTNEDKNKICKVDIMQILEKEKPEEKSKNKIGFAA